MVESLTSRTMWIASRSRSNILFAAGSLVNSETARSSVGTRHTRMQQQRRLSIDMFNLLKLICQWWHKWWSSCWWCWFNQVSSTDECQSDSDIYNLLQYVTLSAPKQHSRSPCLGIAFSCIGVKVQREKRGSDACLISTWYPVEARAEKERFDIISVR
jgi:hypothetical protein